MRIRKNESSATARTMFVVVYDTDGGLASPEAVPASMLYYDDGSGALAAASGTWGPRTRALVVADFTFTADASTDVITAAAHTLKTGDGPIFPSNSGGGLPGGLVALTGVYVVRIDDDTFKVASSLANALAGTTIDISSVGTGTQTFSDSAATRRCMRGQFLYTFTQTEANVSSAYISLTVSDDDTAVRTTEQTADVYQRAHDEDANVGGRTYGDLARWDHAMLTSPNLAYPPDGSSASVDYKDPDTSTVRATVQITATGRGTVTPGDVT